MIWRALAIAAGCALLPWLPGLPPYWVTLADESGG